MLQSLLLLSLYFAITVDKDGAARFQRLHTLFMDPMTEIHLLFYQSALQVFVHYMFLQTEDPLIPVIHDEMIKFITKLTSTFMPVTAIQEVNGNFYNLDFVNKDSQLSGIYSVISMCCRNNAIFSILST